MSFFRRVSQAFKRLKKPVELADLSVDEIQRDGWAQWVIYRFNEASAAGMILLGVLPREKALQKAAEYGKIAFVDDEFFFIFINDR